MILQALVEFFKEEGLHAAYYPASGEYSDRIWMRVPCRFQDGLAFASVWLKHDTIISLCLDDWTNVFDVDLADPNGLNQLQAVFKSFT